jgi:2-polyprenyl-3-methyl-5-hydroxy-6-metoxy-1,4-benzoquinol methylase
MTITHNDTDTDTDDVDVARVEQFAEKIAADQAVSTNAVLAYLGDRLGLWRALASVPSVTSEQLSVHTGLAERYVREWLAAQAAAGYVEYEPASRAFRLPVEHAAVLADDDSPAAMAGGFEFLCAVWQSVDRLAHAWATGEGIPWGEHDPRLFTGVERFYRPLYAGSLVSEWVPAVDGLEERLQRGARVLDVGCGLGSSTVMLAQAFPASSFTGIDDHPASVERAVRAAARAGVDDRVRFCTEAADEHRGGPYDLVCFFDALHDMGDPVAALVRASALLSHDGVVMAVEPAAEDRLEDNLTPAGLSWYASSALVCVPTSLSQPGRLALGAQAGPERSLDVLRQAGLSRARVAVRTAFNLVLEGRR